MDTTAFATSTIELSRSALARNVRYLRRRIGGDVRLTAVVKGNAYGHGLGVFVPLAEACGIDSFAVFSAEEALTVHRARQAQGDLVIMGHVAGDALAWAVENDVGVYVFDLERLQETVALARRVGRPARVHLEVETGLHRTGFDPDALPDVVALLRDEADHVRLDGLCTHFAGAESSANLLRIRGQLDLFRAREAWLGERGVTARHRHTACSAAALTLPESRFDMVRVGIALYGFWPSVETQMQVILEDGGHVTPRRSDPLRRVITWKSRVMGTKRVAPGQFVGYGTAYLTTRPQRLALVPVGYSHGFTRALTNVGHVLIHGRRAPVVGVVNMSMMMIDVTDLRTVERGDEVVLIGRQRGAQITVGSFSDMSRFLNYEALVRLPSRIPRVVVP